MHPKTPSFEMASVYGCIILLSFTSLFLAGQDNYNILSLTSISYAHLSHLPHYNGFGAAIGKYYVDEALDPEFTPPLQPTQITFSIQDYGGNDVYNVYTMVEIYEDSTGQRIKAFPWTKQDIGDFSLYYTFPSVGNFNIVLSIANDNSGNNHNGIDPPRNILTSNLNCDCDRGVFSVSTTKSFGNIFFTAIFAGILAAIAVFGSVAAFAYKSRKKHTKQVSDTNNDNSRTIAEREIVIKYLVMMLAIGAGIVHLAVYSEHGSLRIQYSIFLLAAAAGQFAYGIVYVLMTLTTELDSIRSVRLAKEYYKKSVILNLFGLIGTSVLLGLYIYSVVLPPPLSPINRPEAVDLAGILDKSLEVVLIIGIVYLMWLEKKRITKLLVEVK
jgi:CRISPR/Cas system-associated endoribonuclease Cas2